jgi:hypothetical protein
MSSYPDGNILRLGTQPIAAHEQAQLAEVDLFGLVAVVGRAQHHDQGVAVALEKARAACTRRRARATLLTSGAERHSVPTRWWGLSGRGWVAR